MRNWRCNRDHPQGVNKAGRVLRQVLVDGLGVGDVGNIVLRDRRQLAQDGILIVVITIDKQTGAVIAGPDIISRFRIYAGIGETHR